MRDDLLSRISVNPAMCHGKPCIKGHRIMVSVILDRLATGETPDDLVRDYPGITLEDISACLAYAARVTDASLVTLGG